MKKTEKSKKNSETTNEELINTSENTEEKENTQKEQAETAKEEQAESTEQEESKEGADDFAEKYQSMNEKYLRLAAEYDNYRKRTLKEKMDLIKNAGEDILRNFLPVMDNLDRAKKSIDDSKDIESVKEGINLIHKSLFDFIQARGIKEIEATGEAFDTDLHEAITKIPAPEEKQKGKVIDVVEKGYKLNDKVIRYAKVVVGE